MSRLLTTSIKRASLSRTLAAAAAVLYASPAAAKHKTSDDNGAGGVGFCPKLYYRGTMSLDVNTVFLQVDDYFTSTTAGGVEHDDDERAEGLTVTSFFNVNYEVVDHGQTEPLFPPYAPDQVGIIRDLDEIDFESFDPSTDFERITDVNVGPGEMFKTVWPNEAARVPDGILPFQGVVVPQGFHLSRPPGRLVIINLDDPDRTEYVIHQSTLDPSLPPDQAHTPGNSPRFYHELVWRDMDGDGLEDAVTVRSGFRVGGGPPYPPSSELLYFVHPGLENLDPSQQWEEVTLYGGPAVGFLGPDVHLEMSDLDKDGTEEVVATHLFTGDDPANARPTKGQIAIYGPPPGMPWSDVNADLFLPARRAVIWDDQSFPLNARVVDLNGDGRDDILATNHQPDSCGPFPPPAIPGRVYALEQPDSGKLFDDPWPMRILLDDIQPQPAVYRFPRSAPGHALPFHPKEKYAPNRDGNDDGSKVGKKKKKKKRKRPWILLSGDEAGKVWVLKPSGRYGFEYEKSVIFDINDFYGPGTTQSLTERNATISTVGKPAIRYIGSSGRRSSSSGSGTRSGGKKGRGEAEIYIPIFEAGDIHVLSFAKKAKGTKKISCPGDVTLECPATPAL